jgi:hypothetical protein
LKQGQWVDRIFTSSPCFATESYRSVHREQSLCAKPPGQRNPWLKYATRTNRKVSSKSASLTAEGVQDTRYDEPR